MCHILKKKNCLFVLALLCIALLVGSFYDYQISLFLYNPDSIVAILLAGYGQLPAMLCASVGGLLFILSVDTHKKLKKYGIYLWAVLLHFYAIMGISIDPILYIKKMPLSLSVCIAICIVIVVDILIYRLTRYTSITLLKKAAIVLVTTMFLEIIIINIIKLPWARPRMRLLAEQSQAIYQPWWVIGCKSKDYFMSLGVLAEEFKSFPSGHAGNAACAMLLGILPYISIKLKGKENILFFMGVLITFVVAFSRIVMGAHFLSDVTFGIGITVGIEILLTYFILNKEKSN